MSDKKKYFDITKLLPVAKANGMNETYRFMKFWAEGEAKIAKVPSGGEKATISANVGEQMRILQVDWNWLFSFPLVRNKYDQLLATSAINGSALEKILKTYQSLLRSGKAVNYFNDWLQNGLAPLSFNSKIREHQLQFIEIRPFQENGGKLNDLVGALNNFCFYVFYKGAVITA